MMRAVVDGQTLPQVEVMPSRGRRSKYEKPPRRPASPSNVNRVPVSVDASTTGALPRTYDKDSRKKGCSFVAV